MSRRRSSVWVGQGVALSLASSLWLLPAGSGAAVTITAAKTTDTATVATCKSGAFKDCTSKAHVDKATPLAGGNADFKKAFDDWNGAQAANAKWSLVDGGALPGGDFTVSQFQATANTSFGGMSIIVDWSYAGADKSSYLWSQGLSINYAPGMLASGTPDATSSFKLDTDAFSKLTACNNTDVGAVWNASPTMGNYYCGPAYPFQTGARQLGDGPKGPWPNSSFEAYAFVSKVDASARKLTLYEGVEYGFVLSATPVPEPGAWQLTVVGIGLLYGRRLRRRARRG